MRDFFTRIWEMIVGFFQGIGKFFTDIFSPHAAEAPPKTPGNSAPQNPNVPVAELTQEKPPLVDDQARAEVVATLEANRHLKAIEYVPSNLLSRFSNVRDPVDGRYGTSLNPVLDQANDGRLIVNIPTGSQVGLRQASGDPGMAVLLVMPPQDKPRYSEPFKSQVQLIPKKLLESAQVVFNPVDLLGMPANHGDILMAVQPGLLKDGTALVMQNVDSKVTSRNVDVYVNGNFQRGTSVSGVKDSGEMLKGMIIAQGDDEKRGKLIERFEDDGHVLSPSQTITKFVAVPAWYEENERREKVADAAARAKNAELADARRSDVTYHGAKTSTHQPRRDSADIQVGMQTHGGIRARNLGTGYSH